MNSKKLVFGWKCLLFINTGSSGLTVASTEVKFTDQVVATTPIASFHPTLSTSPATIFPLIPIIAGAVGMVLLCCSVIAVVSIIVVISKRRRKKPAISTYEMNIVIQNPHSGTCVFIALLTCTNT